MLLAANGTDVEALLFSDGSGEQAESVARADLCELVLAASMVAIDGSDALQMFMPNVPKMSRRKSDSGVDIVEPR